MYLAVHSISGGLPTHPIPPQVVHERSKSQGAVCLHRSYLRNAKSKPLSPGRRPLKEREEVYFTSPARSFTINPTSIQKRTGTELRSALNGPNFEIAEFPTRIGAKEVTRVFRHFLLPKAHVMTSGWHVQSVLKKNPCGQSHPVCSRHIVQKGVSTRATCMT